MAVESVYLMSNVIWRDYDSVTLRHIVEVTPQTPDYTVGVSRRIPALGDSLEDWLHESFWFDTGSLQQRNTCHYEVESEFRRQEEHMKQQSMVCVGGPLDGRVVPYHRMPIRIYGKSTVHAIRPLDDQQTEPVFIDEAEYHRHKVCVEQEIYEGYVFNGTPEAEWVEAIKADIPRIVADRTRQLKRELFGRCVDHTELLVMCDFLEEHGHELAWIRSGGWPLSAESIIAAMRCLEEADEGWRPCLEHLFAEVCMQLTVGSPFTYRHVVDAALRALAQKYMPLYDIAGYLKHCVDSTAAAGYRVPANVVDSIERATR